MIICPELSIQGIDLPVMFFKSSLLNYPKNKPIYTTMKTRVALTKKMSYPLFLILVLGGCLSATLPPAIPVPANVSVLSPDPALPEGVKLLSGKWVGEVASITPWHSQMIVESLKENSAQIVYAHNGHHNDPRGGSAKTAHCHCAPNWGRMKGDIDHDQEETTLRFVTPTGKISLVVKKDRPDLMEGYLVRKNGSYPVKMKKVLGE
jgi:hypothetical protein